MKKIVKGTDNGVFDWILESDKNSAWPEGNTDMIRVLVKRYNEMVDFINEKLESKYQEGFEHGYDNGFEDSKNEG